MKNDIRIPVFDKYYYFNIDDNVNIEIDDPDIRWIDSEWKPDSPTRGIGYDSAGNYEILRLMKYKTCPFCRNMMINMIDDDDYCIYVCNNCFYWAGRGTRWGAAPGCMVKARASLGRLKIVDNPDNVTLDYLINHLNANIDRLYSLTPSKAEQLLPTILSDYLQCEVKAFGGVKDGGIDALALRGDNTKILIQIKWREKARGAESVSVIREVGGTLLARGIPNGLIVTTRERFSAYAETEVRQINTREIVNIGQIHIDLADFNSLIDMFEVSARKRAGCITPFDITKYEHFYIFGNGHNPFFH